MTKDDYLKTLESYLNNLSPNDREDTLSHFREYFEDSGLSEATIMQELGDPKEAAEEVLKNLYPETKVVLNQPLPIKNENNKPIICQENIKSVHLTLDQLAVVLRPSKDGQVMIDYDNQDSPYHPTLNIDSHSGQLTITETPAELKHKPDKTKGFWGNFVKIIIQDTPTAYIDLPENLSDLTISSHLGDIDVSQLQCQTLTLNNRLADITLTQVSTQTVAIVAKNGDIVIKNSRMLSGSIKNANGDIGSDASYYQDTSITNDNGDIDLENNHFINTNFICRNGDIDSHTDHMQQAKIEVSNGDVDVDKTLFAGNITMTNSNGDTSVRLNQDPSQMNFYLETKMGDIDLNDIVNNVQVSLFKKIYKQSREHANTTLSIISQMGDIDVV